MKEKTTLLKSLLVAAGLLAGTSAWADEITATLVHTASSSVAGTKGTFTSTVDAENEHINNASLDGTWGAVAYAEFSFTIPAGHSITGATFTFTGLGESRNKRNCDVYYVTAGSSLDYTELSGGSAKVNLDGTKITSVTFPKGATATQEFKIDAADALKAMVTAGQSSIIFKLTGNPGGGDLKGKGSSVPPTLVISTADASSTTSYSIVCKAGETTLKTYDHPGFTIGDDFTASDEEMNTALWNEGKKYVYSSGNTTKTAVADAAENIITLTFVEATKYSYSIKTSLGTTLESASNYKDETVNYYFPYYLLNGDDLYVGPKNSSGTYFGGSFVLDTDDKEITLTYTKNESISNIVFLKEAEDIETMTAAQNAYINIRCSNGVGAYSGEDAIITSLAPGKYKIKTASYANNSTSFIFKVGEETVLTHTGNGGFSEVESEEFEVLTTSDITVKGGSMNYALDYVIIYKTGDIETATVTDAGWATFVPSFNVTIPDGVEAYYVSAVSTTATLTQVETAIPAGAPVLLKAAEGTYTFTQAASAAAIDGNLLKISDGEAMNVLVLYNGDKGVGFYNWTDELPLGKVYLDVSALGRDFIGLSFGEATAIKGVESAKENGAFYNLAGQRVAQPTRGLYIVNGKKVVIK